MSSLRRLNNRLEAMWPRASLRAYLIAIMLLTIAPIAAILSLQVFTEVRSQQSQLEDELARSASALSEAVQRELVSSLDGLSVLAQSELFQQGRIQALGRLLQGRPRRDWDSVFLLERDGSVVLDTAAAQLAAEGPGALRDLHRQVLAQRGAAVAGVSPVQHPGERFVAIAMPVVQNGAVRYVLGARMSETVWQRLTGSASKPAGANAAIFDAQDHLIGYSRADAAPAGSALPQDVAASMRDRPSGVHRSSDVDGLKVYAAWDSVAMAHWRVRVAVPAVPLDAAHRKAMLAALGTSGGSLLLGLLLAALVARRVAQPLQRLATQGAAGLPGAVPVREVTMLRDALLRSQLEDDAAHSRLRVRAEEFEALLHNSPVAMAFAHDTGCREISHNAAMDALIGPRGSQTTGSVRMLHQGRVLAPGQQPLQRAATLGETVGDVELEIAVEGRDFAHVIANAVPLHDAHGRLRGAISTMVDITERKRAEQQLIAADRAEQAKLTQDALAARRQAEAASRAKDEFLAMLSHEVRNRLGTISAAVDVLEAADPATDSAARARDIIGRQVRNLSHRMNDLPDMGRVIADKIALARQPVNLAEEVLHADGALGVTGDPREQPVQPLCAAPSAPDGDMLPPSRRRKVLVIEDNSDLLAALRSRLELDGHSVSTAADGVEGLGRLLKLSPEVSIVDIGLPGQTGFELARDARAAGYAGRMIALSGYGAERDAHAALVAGFDAYLVQPVDRDQLRASLSAD